jgi:CDGSH iron-sulfur domain-containing protein 3
MEPIIITPNKPIAIELEPGTYHRCTCDKSAKPPFCDGSHKGTDFRPLAFKVTEQQKVYLCNCGRTANSPYCDGSHKKI